MTEPVDHDASRRLGEHFETLHAGADEPWSFSARGVERLRHDRMLERVRALAPRRMLDVGCSLGQLTAKLVALDTELHAVDLSPSAAARARELVRGLVPGSGRRVPAFSVASAAALPYRAESFDLVLALDGLFSWQLDAPARAETLAEIHASLVPGGRAIFSDHMRPAAFPEFVACVGAGSLRVVGVEYLYDRPCYQLEGLLKGVREWRVARALRASTAVAGALCAVGRLAGPRASRHILVVTQRPDR